MTTQKQVAERRKREVVADIAGQLAALRQMTVGELRERHLEVFGEPSRSRNKDYLYKKVAWRIQEMAEGGLSERALAKIDEFGRIFTLVMSYFWLFSSDLLILVQTICLF